MKKLKIILPTIALLVVLTMSLTIGVFAAQQSTLTITSTVTFFSPDIEAKVFCYIGEPDGTPDFIYPNAESKTTWTISPADFSFKTTAGSADVEDAILTFEITNNTMLPLYSYFTKDGEEKIITTDSLNGNLKIDETPVNPNIVAVSLDGQKKIPAKQNETATTQTSIISFKLNNNLKVQDSATFNYSLVLSKNSANLFDIGETSEYTDAVTLSKENGTITRTANQYTNSVKTYKKTNLAPGTYTISAQSTGSQGLRFLARMFDEEGNILTNSSINVDTATYNASYEGWWWFRVDNTSPITITIPELVDHWWFGVVFRGENGEAVTYSDISILMV